MDVALVTRVLLIWMVIFAVLYLALVACSAAA